MGSASPVTFLYDGARKAGVTLIALVALSSLLAIFYLFTIHRPKAQTFRSTHLFGYFMCLLFANVIQGTGTIIDFEWVAKGGVVEGFSCSLQGALKQTGNLSASFWSLITSIHIFLLLFFKIRSNQATFIGIIILTWTVILIIPLVGRFVLQKEELGPYYGIAGEWCWISPKYQDERIFLECVFSLFTIGISFILYSAILLRVRGNLVKDQRKKWSLRFFGKGVGGDDDCMSDKERAMMKIAKNMIWYPISYTAVMLPMTMIRVVEIKYNSVPFAVTAISGILFNSMGLINVILLIRIARAFNRIDILPQVAPREFYLKASIEGAKQDALQVHEPRPSRDSGDDQEDTLKHSPSVLLKVKVDLPTKPVGTYVAPDSWKTSSPGGKKY